MRQPPLLIRDARVLAGDRVLPRASVLVSGGRIREVSRSIRRPKDAELIEARGRLLAPGLIDIHINGGFGKSFDKADPEEIRGVGKALVEEGVTAYVPTLLSLPLARTRAALRRIGEAAKREGGAKILGAHLEGPYLNPARRGAHRKEFLRRPSLKEFRSLLSEFRGLIKMMTIAPELPGAEEVIRCGRDHGILMCAGHSDASARELERGARAGIRHVTHLFNAMRRFHHREEGLLERALLDDRLSCELIYDRRHLSRGAAELVLRCKPADRVVLVSDATFALRAREGRYRVGADQYDVRRGEIRLAGSGLLAGSAVSLLDVARALAQDLRLPPERALPLASANPARALGLRQGVIRPGRPADLVLFGRKWSVAAVIVGGIRWK
ncbi:MAG: N-acetylglucosamine-6-phosphate deacetylase [Elusimicrobiota bacterium]